MRLPLRRRACYALGAIALYHGVTNSHPSALAQFPGRVVDVNARDYFFQAPDTIQAGLVTLRLWQRGREHHNLELIRIDSGHTASEWYRTALAHQLPSWATNLGGPGFARIGQSSNATYLLQPGSYLLMCSVGSARTVDSLYHVWRGMVRPLHVRGSRAVGQIPRPDIIARITDHGVELSGTLRAGPRLLRVENAGTSVHEFGLRHVKQGRTAAEALAWRRAMGTPEPDTLVSGLGDLEPGRVVFTTITLAPGDYIAKIVPSRNAPGAQTVFRIDPASAR